MGYGAFEGGAHKFCGEELPNLTPVGLYKVL